jgi:serine phosphatase RsbU (regulator of sigma subunit)
MKLVDSFAGEAPQFDDITMLSFTYRGREASGISVT